MDRRAKLLKKWHSVLVYTEHENCITKHAFCMTLKLSNEATILIRLAFVKFGRFFVE